MKSGFGRSAKGNTKLVIVDLYGIISLGSFWDITHWLAKKFKRKPHGIYDVLYHKYFNAAALGKIGERELFTKALDDLDIDADWRAVRDKHLTYQVPNKPAIELCKRLQKDGYTVLLLSKNIPSHMRHTIRAFGLQKYFKHITNTYDLSLPKASKRTMLWALKRFRVKPSEVVFCDDQDFNLVEAKKMGIRTVLYKNVRQFKTDLRKALATRYPYIK